MRFLSSIRTWIGLVVAVSALAADPAWGQLQFQSMDAQDDALLNTPRIDLTQFTAPPATLEGTITPTPTWDPYGNPASAAPAEPYYPTAPPPAYPGTPDGSSIYAPGEYLFINPDGSMGRFPRLFREFRFEYTWLSGDGTDNTFGFDTAELSTTATVPFFYSQSPLLVTPGFAAHFLNGPADPVTGADMPPVLYDAYLDLAWRPQVTPWLSGDLGVRVGVYSDFSHFTSESIRVMGRGLGVLAFSPTVQVALGVMYLDRSQVTLLPAGGVIWTPHEDARYEILFPNPKLARRLTTIGTTDLWWYVAGEYGGGAWTIERAGGTEDAVDYSDLRVIGGLEWRTLAGLRGNFEVGYVFNREFDYESDVGDAFDIDDTIMLRGILAY